MILLRPISGKTNAFFSIPTRFRCGSVFKLEDKMYFRDCTAKIIAAAIKVHSQLGPGLLESAYEACLAHELDQAGLLVQRQRAVPLVYGTVKLDCGFRADLVINREVVVEIKCKESFHPVDEAQLLSYLRLLDLRVGLLINFHVAALKDGIKRMVNNYEDVETEAEYADTRTPEAPLARFAGFLRELRDKS